MEDLLRAFPSLIAHVDTIIKISLERVVFESQKLADAHVQRLWHKKEEEINAMKEQVRRKLKQNKRAMKLKDAELELAKEDAKLKLYQKDAQINSLTDQLVLQKMQHKVEMKRATLKFNRSLLEKDDITKSLNDQLAKSKKENERLKSGESDESVDESFAKHTWIL